MNLCIFIGNLTADPEMKYTENGKAVTTFSIAINNGKDKDGYERPPTYVDFEAWERLAETVAEFLSKGKKCAVTSQFTSSKYEDRDGIKRTRVRFRASNVEFLSPREDRDEESRRPSKPQQSRRPAPRDDDLDDLPF